MTLYQDCSSNGDSSNNMAARGRGLFSLYIFIENFKMFIIILMNPSLTHYVPIYVGVKTIIDTGSLKFNDLVRNDWTDFNITLQESFFCNPLPRFFKTS